MLEYGKLKPMEPRSAKEPFDAQDYLYQVKWDGVRIIAFIANGQTRLQNRKLKARTNVYPDFANLHQYIKAQEAILDGEMIVLKNGKPSFKGILKRDLKTDLTAIQVAARQIPATYVTFDLLALNGQSLLHLPLEQRLENLRAIAIPHDYFQVIEDFSSGIALFQVIEAQELEGIVAKQRRSPYILGEKTNHWLKVKTHKDIIALVGGYTIKERQLSSLLIGAYLDKQFYYIGNASTGLTGEDMRILGQYLIHLEVSKPLFANPPRGNSIHWVKPLLTVKLEFMEWTSDLQMRSPVILGFTKDLPEDCQIH